MQKISMVAQTLPVRIAPFAKAVRCTIALLTLMNGPVSLESVGEESESASSASVEVQWPTVTQTARPWTRWWWHGSAVDEKNLSRLLEEYHAAGLGGVEITCIFGVKGNEGLNREYLSPAWLEAVQHTLREAKRLGLGVDLPAGSGWRMGGPSVKPADADSKVVIESAEVSGGKTFSRQFGTTTPQAVIARDAKGSAINLMPELRNGILNWQAPGNGAWSVYTLFYRWAGDHVKRPAPGGEGRNINPFSKTSISKYLTFFGKQLDQLPGIRAQFHDSFEYEGDWQPDFLEEFARRRGYRLEEHLPAFAGDGPKETVARVKCDYRETLSDLVLENLVQTWVEWAHEHGQLARNQSHGSPANWLDLYAACDIPEMESFGRLQGGDADQLVLKFASSAANVAGRSLVSSESATWLDEHFNVTLEQIKQMVDRQILAGVNHVFFHGTAYSPKSAVWPGWLFYASTQLNPQNPIWRDLPELNAYVTRCQSVLQASRADNDVLLYWPIHDMWHNERGLRQDFQVHNDHEWFQGQSIGDAAKILQESGYAFDYVSDLGLSTCNTRDDGVIKAPGCEYAAVIVPKAIHMPLATLDKLGELAEAGGKIIFWGDLPQSEPGMAGAAQSLEWDAAIKHLRQFVDRGLVMIGDNLPESLHQVDVRHEKGLTAEGISFLRKKWDEDTVYLLKNSASESFDGWVLLAVEFRSAAFLEPMTGRVGIAKVRSEDQGGSSVRLQLAPDQSILARVSPRQLQCSLWPYLEVGGQQSELEGPWQVEFVSGGPKLSAGFVTSKPQPWTAAPDKSAESFAGTVKYSQTFDCPNPANQRWLLDLGKVLGSARVKLNGRQIATLIAPPFRTRLDELRARGNRLEVEVTGVAANRIRHLDREGVEWRIFEDINLVNIDYQEFDASNWPVRPLGLAGPVTLVPLQ